LQTKLDADTGAPVSGDDALRDLCYADALFRQRYEGWRPLGRGPWATVVAVCSRDLREDIALKVFVNIDPELLERVRQEVRAVQAVATPYIVSTHSLFDRGAVAWFEMELVQGPNLRQELDRLAATESRLSLIRCYEIALAVSRCLWHAHRRGVLHRDIKPANVLLPSTGQPAAKLGDFGIARLADVASTTPRNAVMGTPRVASPEALGGEPVGPPHDVYGLGVTLYTLLTGGRPPYELTGSETLAELRRLQAAARPPSIGSLVGGVDRDVDAVIVQSLALDANERPGPGDVVRALERAQARAAAAAFRRGEGADVSVSAWRIAVAGFGLAALGLWARLRARDRNDESAAE
jgi:serine/threonine protein kinase